MRPETVTTSKVVIMLPLLLLFSLVSLSCLKSEYQGAWPQKRFVQPFCDKTIIMAFSHFPVSLSLALKDCWLYLWSHVSHYGIVVQLPWGNSTYPGCGPSFHSICIGIEWTVATVPGRQPIQLFNYCAASLKKGTAVNQKYWKIFIFFQEWGLDGNCL